MSNRVKTARTWDKVPGGASPCRRRNTLAGWAPGWWISTSSPGVTTASSSPTPGLVGLEPVIWRSPAPPGTPGVPTVECLERIVCAALAGRWPDRADRVQQWLDQDGDDPVGPKHFAWSWMSRWFAESECDRFYSALWEDELIATRLIVQLDSSPAWKRMSSFREP